MKHEFTKISKGNETHYVLENASAGGTSSGSIASVSTALGGVRKRGDNLLAQEAGKNKVPATTPRNFVAKNAKTSGAGAHTDKKKAAKQGDVKHKSRAMDMAEANMEEDSIRPNLAAALKELGFKGPIKLGQLPEWMVELQDGRFDKDTSIMIGGDDPKYDPWVAKGHEYGYAYGMESGYQTGLSAQEVLNQATADTQNTKSVEEDHEIQMASNELQAIAKNAVHLLDLVKRYSEAEGLEAWQQSKITKAADYLNSVLQSISGEQNALEGLRDPKDNPCWKGYKPVGTKQKGGRTVPNCVPKESVAEGSGPKEKQKTPYRDINSAEYRAAADKQKQQMAKDKLAEPGKKLLAKKGVAEGSDDELNARPGMWRGNAKRMTAKGKPTKDELGMQDNLKNRIKASNKKGGITGPKGPLPEEQGVAEVSDSTKQSYKAKAQAQVKELEPHAKKGEYKDIAQRAIDRRTKGLARVKEDDYMAELSAKMAEKLDPNADPDVWVQDFQKADPNKYHQFRNKTPEKKAQMAIAARYAAKQPKSKR